MTRYDCPTAAGVARRNRRNRTHARGALVALLISLGLAAGSSPLTRPVTATAAVTAVAADARLLALDAAAFPAGASITYMHAYRTAHGVDGAYSRILSSAHQGDLYARLGFAGTLGQLASAGQGEGVRHVQLLATLFPTAATARQAYASDARQNIAYAKSFHGSDESSRCFAAVKAPLGGQMQSCASAVLDGASFDIVGVVDKAEFIVGVDTGAPQDIAASERQAQADATLVAGHEAGRIAGLAAAGRLAVVQPLPVPAPPPGVPAPCRSPRATIVDAGDPDLDSMTLHGSYAFDALCIIDGGALRADGDLRLRVGYLYIDGKTTSDADGNPVPSAIAAGGTDGQCGDFGGDPEKWGGTSGYNLTILAHQAVVLGAISADGGYGANGHCGPGDGGSGGSIVLRADTLTLMGTISARGGDGGAAYALNQNNPDAGYPGRGGAITLLSPHPAQAASRQHLHVEGGQGSGASVPGAVRIAAPTPADPVFPSGATPGEYDAVTGHNLTGAFYRFYHQTPDAPRVYGQPETKAFIEDGRPVQYFDRVAMQNQGGRVALLPLGRLLTRTRAFARVAPFPSTAVRRYFPATGHSLSGLFLAYWKGHQGATYLGAPLSEVVMEGNGDGSGNRYPIQWFEYGRLEYHAENKGTRYAVQLGPLGLEMLKAKGLS